MFLQALKMYDASAKVLADNNVYNLTILITDVVDDMMTILLIVTILVVT